MTQEEVYELFGKIDRLPGIMEPRIGRWRAWPIAKMPLLWQLMQGETADAAARSGWDRLKDRVPRYAADVSTAIKQFAKARRTPSGGVVGMMYLPRPVRSVNGQVQDFIFGNLLDGEGLARPSLALEQPWPDGSPARHASDSAVDLRPYHSFAEQYALLLMASPRLRSTATEINARLQGIDMPLDATARGRKILLGLSLFEAKRRLFKWLIRRLRLRALVITYGPGRFGEIAAARDAGLPVIELQHGVIGPHCPDYAWPAGYRACKAEMPLPDRIAVFGQVFRDLILRSGFWHEDEILPLGAAAMETFRGSVHARRGSGPLRLVFMTQATSRPAAVSFWREVAASPAFNAAGYQVALKVHPEERREADVYRNVVAQARDRFELLPFDSNPIDVMFNADVVISYNSMALIEALGLGVPAVSICGGSIPGGFAGMFGLGGIVSVMPHVRTPDDLCRILRERATDDGKLSQWRSAAEAEGRNFFADGFTVSAKALINDILAFNPAPASLAVH